MRLLPRKRRTDRHEATRAAWEVRGREWATTAAAALHDLRREVTTLQVRVLRAVDAFKDDVPTDERAPAQRDAPRPRTVQVPMEPDHGDPADARSGEREDDAWKRAYV